MRVRIILLVLLAFFALPRASLAASEFKTDYTVDYYPEIREGSISTRVSFTTQVTNTKNDVYVDKYQLSFPASFAISSITASDDKGPIRPAVKTDEESISISMPLNDPAIGQNTTNTITLSFVQDKLFRVNGNVWEVVIPTISGRDNGSYRVRMHMPKTTKRMAIAKPQPTRWEGDTIIWENPTVKTLYAVFGDTQYYTLGLKYHLANEKSVPVYTEVAFPPDTLYQKIFIDLVSPPPTSVRRDEDGNTIARYDLDPKQSLEVQFTGHAQIFAKPREEMKAFVRSQFETQKTYLLQERKYWTLSDKSKYAHLNTPQKIYGSVVDTFSYDFDRLNAKKSIRLGATEALKNPKNAVCVEFSDTFIAKARAVGIYAREIQGYGFSQDERLRPISLTNDVLHAWPEYYDESAGIWRPVDPTWENTSGIDYFSSFDLDHIAFVVHGKDSEEPAPAGTYKYKNSRDVDIKATSVAPTESTSLLANRLTVAPSIGRQDKRTGSVRITNQGNTTLYAVPVTIEGNGVTVAPAETTIPQLAPFETHIVSFTYAQKPTEVAHEGSITVLAGRDSTVSQSIRLVSAWQPYLMGGAVVLVALGIGLVVYIRTRRMQPPLTPPV